MTFLTRIIEVLRRWYGCEISRQRRAVEEDARRLGGTVYWDQT